MLPTPFRLQRVRLRGTVELSGRGCAFDPRGAQKVTSPSTPRSRYAKDHGSACYLPRLRRQVILVRAPGTALDGRAVTSALRAMLSSSLKRWKCSGVFLSI